MIEVRGKLGAVEAADAALKSAAVRLLRSRKVGGGLVTVFLTGEVAAVRSAVDAAVNLTAPPPTTIRAATPAAISGRRFLT